MEENKKLGANNQDNTTCYMREVGISIQRRKLILKHCHLKSAAMFHTLSTEDSYRDFCKIFLCGKKSYLKYMRQTQMT